MNTLEKTYSLNSLDIDGLTDISDENAASCCGGVSARFIPSGASNSSPGIGLQLYDRSLFNADASDKPGTGYIGTRGPRADIDLSVGQTVNIPSELNDKVSTAISIEGIYELHEHVDGGGRSVRIGPGADISTLDFATGAVKFTAEGGGGFSNTGQGGVYNDIFSSVTRVA